MEGKANEKDFICDDCKKNDGLVFYIGQKQLCLACARKAKREEIKQRNYDAWVKRINALAKEIDDTAASVHPSAWKEALAPLAEKYAAACASQKAGDPLPADA